MSNEQATATRQKATKQTRLSFQICNAMNVNINTVEKHFNYNDKLTDVITFIISETGINDFIFSSRYPKLNIDAKKLDVNETKNKLQQTLYELDLVPNGRIYITTKPDRRMERNIVMRFGYFIIDTIQHICRTSYEITVAPLKYVGIMEDKTYLYTKKPKKSKSRRPRPSKNNYTNSYIRFYFDNERKVYYSMLALGGILL
eukprot:UN06880